ncbi:MAG: patatin-like phospholipase family protein [Hungatella sp.]|nr:patatin-like phospholipase family protein [Hungatella sp.]
MKGTALILAGGGGKGAYQIGVWKAMRELGIDKEIRAVSGASVGGLNGVLFVQGDCERAERIWLSMDAQKILTSDRGNFLEEIQEFMEKGPVMEAEAMMQEGIFSRDGLVQIIRRELDVNKIAGSRIPCYLACYNVSKNLMDYINIMGMTQNDMETILLATSALPGIFGPVKFGRSMYLDGGLKDNVPIRPLYNAGYRDFIVVHLSRNRELDETEFPGAAIVQIVPSREQGDFVTGTLDFSGEGAKRRMEQGYEDGKKVLSREGA